MDVERSRERRRHRRKEISSRGLSLVDCRQYNYASKDNKRGNSKDRVDALSDEGLPVFYKRNVMVACEPGVPLTSSSKTVYANLYRVSHYAVPPSGGSPTTRGWKGRERDDRNMDTYFIEQL